MRQTPMGTFASPASNDGDMPQIRCHGNRDDSFPAQDEGASGSRWRFSSAAKSEMDPLARFWVHVRVSAAKPAISDVLPHLRQASRLVRTVASTAVLL